MSKVHSKETKQVITSVIRTLKGVECDVCKKIVAASYATASQKAPKYYEVTIGHSDWGADSIESRTALDICPECLDKFVHDYLTNAKGTEYIEIETHYAYPQDVYCEE